LGLNLNGHVWEFLCPGFCSIELTPAVQTRCRGTRIFVKICAAIFKSAHHSALTRIVTPSKSARHSPIRGIRQAFANPPFPSLDHFRRQKTCQFRHQIVFFHDANSSLDPNQCRKCRTPVNTIAKLSRLAASMTSWSRTEPPG
jgi:hypothetical protein